MIFLMLFFYLSAEITHFSIPRSCDQLTSIDLSKNELTSLPESLALLANLQKLNASDNKLTQLPLKYVINVLAIRTSSFILKKRTENKR